MTNSHPSTGLKGLDELLKGLIPGDNVVWHMRTIEDYAVFVEPYCRHAVAMGEKPIYFRFAKHAPVVPPDIEAEIHTLHPEKGFENFIGDIHRTIERHGTGGYYVFDSLSDLAVDWFSDQMLANFFVLTCPYLYDVQALAYFALLRHHHSPQATGPIGETAQVLLDLFHHQERYYIQAIKVSQRHSPRMYMLHECAPGNQFWPVTESAITSEVLTTDSPEGIGIGLGKTGVFSRTFLRAEHLLENVEHGQLPPEQSTERAAELVRRIVTRDPRLLRLCQRYFSLADVIGFQKRMIGTGQIGGKAAGMLLAQAILRSASPHWQELMEAHDSFYIGSDVFYTFLVRNGCWWERQKQRDPEHFLEGAGKVRQRLLTGSFPDYVMQLFMDMLDYYGQSPIIVRSSSLLEDSFGHSFVGKYESVFCANQGSRRTRLENFLNAVRTVYASSMSEAALSYRAERGLLEQDEQMALLVQRVSGAVYGDNYYPQIAGVGFSYNPYVWSEEIDPEAGVLRTVFGMGTRAVDRSDDDYTRVIALNAPERRPMGGVDDERKYAQRKIDVLDLEANLLVSKDFQTVAEGSADLPLSLFATRDADLEAHARQTGQTVTFPWMLTFDKLLSETDFVRDTREMLAVLEEAYEYPVDMEFTANFFSHGGYRFNVVQCRPFQVRRSPYLAESPPADIAPENLILEAHGAVIGPSRAIAIDRLVCVVPEIYGRLPIAERYQIARLIGDLMQLKEIDPPEHILLLGPGRWGTTTPSLGVPVRFAEVKTASVVCEVVAMNENLVPDVSLGAHFFNELVEKDILYFALFPDRPDNTLNMDFLRGIPNELTKLLPHAERHAEIIQVIDSREIPNGQTIEFYANSLKQTVYCHLRQNGKS